MFPQSTLVSKINRSLYVCLASPPCWFLLHLHNVPSSGSSWEPPGQGGKCAGGALCGGSPIKGKVAILCVIGCRLGRRAWVQQDLPHNTSVPLGSFFELWGRSGMWASTAPTKVIQEGPWDLQISFTSFVLIPGGLVLRELQSPEEKSTLCVFLLNPS